MSDIPLGVLDLVPVSSGSTAADALRNSIDLARHAERLGYARYWFAEHHLNPGVAGTSPAVVLALTASATSTIRLGSGAVQLGHRTALSTVEEFGRGCSSCRAPSPRTTPSRSTTSSPCWRAPTAPRRVSRRTSCRGRGPRSSCGSSAAAAARAPRSRGRGACGSPPTTTSARPRSWRPWTATAPPSSPPTSSTSPTSPSPPTSWSPRTTSPPGNSPPATARGCAASAPPRVPSPLPHTGGGPRPRLERGGPGAGAGQDRHPVRRLTGPGRRPAGTAPGGHRRRRTAHHHDHPRPRGPGALVRAAGTGVEPALTVGLR